MFGVLTHGHKVLVFYNLACAGILTECENELGKSKVKLGWLACSELSEYWCFS